MHNWVYRNPSYYKPNLSPNYGRSKLCTHTWYVHVTLIHMCLIKSSCCILNQTVKNMDKNQKTSIQLGKKILLSFYRKNMTDYYLLDPIIFVQSINVSWLWCISRCYKDEFSGLLSTFCTFLSTKIIPLSTYTFFLFYSNFPFLYTLSSCFLCTVHICIDTGRYIPGYHINHEKYGRKVSQR